MRRFFRRQATYFIWGFAASLALIVAYEVGLDRLLKYAIASAVVGVVVSAGIFLLERRFPDTPPNIDT
jgi:hypothetical protein